MTYTCALSTCSDPDICQTCVHRLPADKDTLAYEVHRYRTDGPGVLLEVMASLLPNISTATLDRWEKGQVMPNNQARTAELMTLITAREIGRAPDRCPLLKLLGREPFTVQYLDEKHPAAQRNKADPSARPPKKDE